MLGHLRRRPTQRSSTTPICPSGGDGTGRYLCRFSSTMAKHGVRRRFAISTRRARHESVIICVTAYYGASADSPRCSFNQSFSGTSWSSGEV